MGGSVLFSPRRIHHPKIARKPIDTGTKVFHVVNLRTPDDLTEDIKAWLAESYQFAD